MIAGMQVACGIREIVGFLADCFAAKRSRFCLHNLLTQQGSQRLVALGHEDPFLKRKP